MEKEDLNRILTKIEGATPTKRFSFSPETLRALNEGFRRVYRFGDDGTLCDLTGRGIPDDEIPPSLKTEYATRNGVYSR